MTHPGVGALTALACVLIIGRAERFQCGKQIGSYLGLVPLEDSSGHRRRLGHITKQGNSILRFLLVEAAQVAARSFPEWRSRSRSRGPFSSANTFFIDCWSPRQEAALEMMPTARRWR
jgi:transposase